MSEPIRDATPCWANLEWAEGEISRLTNEVNRRDVVLDWLVRNNPSALEVCPVKVRSRDPLHAELHTEYDIELALIEGWLVLERGYLHPEAAQASADDFRRHEFPNKTIRVVRKTVTRETL